MVRRYKGFWEPMIGLQLRLIDMRAKTFEDLRHHAIGIRTHFEEDSNILLLLQAWVHTFNVRTSTIERLLPSSWNYVRIIFSPAHCGRESERTRRLGHSDAFLQTSVPTLMFPFSFAQLLLHCFICLLSSDDITLLESE